MCAGDDTLTGGLGDDVIIASDGSDTVSVSSGSGVLTVEAASQMSVSANEEAFNTLLNHASSIETAVRSEALSQVRRLQPVLQMSYILMKMRWPLM